MSVVRWVFPIVLCACLGGFLVGYIAPGMINDTVGCWGGMQCGAAHGTRFEMKPVKAAMGEPATPALLTRIEGARRGETLQIVLQTLPGAVCAIRFQDAALNTIYLPAQFADNEGRCMAIWAVPETAALGKANLLICASACLEDEVWPYFSIQ